MNRIDSFFKKCDTPMKKQRDDKKVKEDKAQPSNSEPKNHSSARESSSDLVQWLKHLTLSSRVESNISLGIYHGRENVLPDLPRMSTKVK